MKKLEELIASNPNIVHFGNEDNSVSQEWIEKAEKTIGLPLTNSYKWFLKKYGGGEIGTEEIYSIYGIDFETANGGDIVYQHIVGKKNGLVDSNELIISETDFGEIFFFDYSYFKENECPINIKIPSKEKLFYADNFYDFLCKRIQAHI